MTEKLVQFEEEITKATTAARNATLALSKEGARSNAAEAVREYETVWNDPALGWAMHIGLSNPKLRESVCRGGPREEFVRKVAGLVEAHLELYEIATQRSEGAAIRMLADHIRFPSLGVLQGGFLCLALIEPHDGGASIPMLEALARKGRVNPVNHDFDVSQAISLLEIELEIRKRPTPATPSQQPKQAGTKGKAAVR